MIKNLYRIRKTQLCVLFIVLVASIFCIEIGAAAKKEQSAYVWDFTTRYSQKNKMTSKFTHDFETAFVQFGCYKILERRNYGRLIAQIDNEKAISEISRISTDTLDNLKGIQANIVIFGEVFDDIDSGEIKITVTFQAFDGTKILMKSIRISRGKAGDAESREKAMKELTDKICLKDTAAMPFNIAARVGASKILIRFQNSSKEPLFISAVGVDLSRPITLKIKKTHYSRSKPPDIKEYKVKRFERRGDPLVEEEFFDNVFYIDNRAGAIRVINTSCDAISGNYPCQILPGSAVSAKFTYNGNVSTFFRTTAYINILRDMKDQDTITIWFEHSNNKREIVKTYRIAELKKYANR